MKQPVIVMALVVAVNLAIMCFHSPVLGQLTLDPSNSESQVPRFGAGDHILLVGDSFTNDRNSDWAGKVRSEADFRLTFFSAAGRSVYLMNRLFADQYTPDTYDAVVIAGGVNDISGRRNSASQIQASIQGIIDQTNGEHIILTTIPPSAGRVGIWNSTMQATADELDAWVINKAASSDSVSLFDIRSILDVNDDQIIDPEFASPDNFHPQSCSLGRECGMSVIADRFISQFTETVMLGDCNVDRSVDFGDIAPFVSFIVLSTYVDEADVNQDGNVNFSGVLPFIDLLTDD